VADGKGHALGSIDKDEELDFDTYLESEDVVVW